MSTFQEAARPFVEQARIPPAQLLPIIPHNAKVSSGSKLDPSARGKAPGIYQPKTETWIGNYVWRAGPPTPRQISTYKTFPTQNVGLSAAEAPGLDLDTGSERVRSFVEALALAYLGPAPVRLRGDAPRCLMPYRMTGEDPIFKVRLEFVVDGVKQAVELLGTGQQYVISGIHPDGSRYHWRQGADLVGWGWDGLSQITATDVRNFFRVLEGEVVAKLGAVGVKSTLSKGTGHDGATPVSEIEGSVQPGIALQALQAVPNTEENLPDRSDLVSMLSAFKAAVGADCERYRPDVEAWATAHGWCEPEYFAKVWDSLTAVRVGPTFLFRKARAAGWHGDAVAEFDAVPIEEAEKPIARLQAEQKRVVEEELRTLSEGLVYHQEEQRWINVPTGEMLTHAALNGHTIGLRIAPAGRSGEKAASAILLNSGVVRRVVGTTYHPGQPELFTQDWNGRNGLWYNQWRPSSMRLREGPIDPWLMHVHWLFNEREREVFLDWCAFVLQHPGVKVRWAPIIKGGQGLGKDLALKPVARMLGSNYKEITPAHLAGNFTDWMKAQVVVVQEMSHDGKLDFYEKLKAMVAGTGADTLNINEKYKPEYSIRNTAAFVFMTNNEDAIRFSYDDRRFCVMNCAPTVKKPDNYYKALANWYDQGGDACVVDWLMHRDVSNFNFDGSPLDTDAKRDMLVAGLPAAAQWLYDELQPGGLFAHRTRLVWTPFRRLVERNSAIPPKVRDALTAKTFPLALQADGWVRRPSPVRLSDGSQAKMWYRHVDQIGEAEGFARSNFERENATVASEFDREPLAG